MPWLIAFSAVCGAVTITALVVVALFASLPRYREDAEQLAKATRELNALSAERLRLQREASEQCKESARQLEVLTKGYERWQALHGLSKTDHSLKN